MNAVDIAREFEYEKVKGKWVSKFYIRCWDLTDQPFGTRVYVSDGVWIYPSGNMWDEKRGISKEDFIKHPLSAKELKELYKEEILDMEDDGIW